MLAARKTAPAAVEPRELAGAVEHLGRGRDVELEVAGDLDACRSERAEPRRIGRGLRTDRAEVAERCARERRHPRVAPRRFFRQARVREEDRDALPPARAHEVRPQLGLHDDAERGPEVCDEPAHRPGEVVRQERERGEVAVEARRRFATGRRHVGDEQRVIGISSTQRPYERLRGPRLAEGDRVDPDERTAGRRAISAEALGDVLPVSRLLAPAPPQPQRQQRQREVQDDAVQGAQHHASRGATSASAASTSATEGAAPASPRNAIGPEPRGPVRLGSEPA